MQRAELNNGSRDVPLGSGKTSCVLRSQSQVGRVGNQHSAECIYYGRPVTKRREHNLPGRSQLVTIQFTEPSGFAPVGKSALTVRRLVDASDTVVRTPNTFRGVVAVAAM